MNDLRARLVAAIGDEQLCNADVPRGFDETMADRAGAALPAVAVWLRVEETGDLMAEAMERHHLVYGQPDAMGNTPCVCGQWWDSADMEGWDQHLAYVGLRALADSLTRKDPE